MSGKRRRKGNIWFIFITRTFLVLLGLMMVTFVCALIAHRLGVDLQRPVPMGGFLILGGLSAAIGAVLAGIVASSVLRPVQRLSEATKRVAAGDFGVRLETDSNIPEIGQLYDNFNKMVTDLSGIETLRSDFVSNVSHEFKTPLSAIEGYATLLGAPDQSEAERAECTLAIRDGARRLSGLVSNVLSLSKLDNQRIILDKRPFKLDEQIRQTLLTLEPQWSAKQLDLRLDLPEAELLASEELLAQVWLNLLQNAIKFSPEGGALTVQLQQTPSRAMVMICDEGIGMALEEQRHAFEKFYQADRAHAAEGNGLGLALVKRILDLSGGRIAVESAPGKGARFTVTLPKA